MLARKKSSKNGKIIPLDWSEGVARLLNDGFKAECKQNGRYFDVYGQFFNEEIGGGARAHTDNAAFYIFNRCFCYLLF